MNEKDYLNKIPVPITITKGDKIIYINEETEKFTGYKKEELIGKEIFTLYPSLYEFENIKRKTFENGYMRGARTKLKSKEGKLLDVIVHINLLDYEDGSKGGIGAILDITEIAEGESKLQESIERLYFLYSTLRVLTSSLQIQEVIKKVIDIIKEYFNIEVIGLSLLKEEDNEKYSEIYYYIGYSSEKVNQYKKLPLKECKDKTAICHAMYTKKTYYIPDTASVGAPYLKLRNDIRSCLAIPIKFKDVVLGGIVLESNEENRFKKEDIELLETITDMLATVLINIELYEKTLELSIKDGLTDTYNYRYFYEEMQREIENYKRYKKPFSLAIVDLDNFKRINDAYGHIEGDKVLQKIGQILKENVRKHIDIVCRYGGDEFSIIFSNTKIDNAINIAQRIIDAINKNKDIIYNITMSIGIAEYKGELPQEFIIKVDKLTYKAKKKGGNRVEAEL